MKQPSLKLRIVDKLRKLAHGVFPDNAVTLWAIKEAMLDMDVAEIKASVAQRDPEALLLSGYKVYSQADEDGIIARIFEIIGQKNRLFVEIGCGNGLENNSHNLLINGWRGVWIDGDADNVSYIQSELAYKRNPVLSVRQAFVNRENVNDIVSAGLDDIGIAQLPAEVDLLSIDIDGNELHVWQALGVVRPRVICMEYNGRFRPPAEIVIQYKGEHAYRGDDYQGASLQFLNNALRAGGYRLVACNISGVNAFFVRTTESWPLPERDISAIYMPPRHYLTFLQPGLPASMKFARDRLAKSAAG
jgi:hypothetical protein